jgi:hypothetical protein
MTSLCPLCGSPMPRIRPEDTATARACPTCSYVEELGAPLVPIVETEEEFTV